MGVVGGCGLVDMTPPTRFNIFTGCPEAKTCTIILRGGAEQFIEETERSLHDAIMIVRRTIKNDAIVAGERRERLYCFLTRELRVCQWLLMSKATSHSFP